MAKLYVILTILSTSTFVLADISIKGMTTKQLEALEARTLEECRVKENVDKSLLEEFARQDGTVPNTPGFKRMLTCVGETIGYSKEGKRDWDKMMYAEEIFFQGNPTAIKQAQDVMVKCRNLYEKQNLDKYEFTYKMANCSKEAFQKANLKFLNLETSSEEE